MLVTPSAAGGKEGGAPAHDAGTGGSSGVVLRFIGHA
jgi:hypothetical protein